MVTAKTTTLTLRIKAGPKEALRTAAEPEYRSIVNTVEVLTRDNFERIGCYPGITSAQKGMRGRGCH